MRMKIFNESAPSKRNHNSEFLTLPSLAEENLSQIPVHSELSMRELLRHALTTGATVRNAISDAIFIELAQYKNLLPAQVSLPHLFAWEQRIESQTTLTPKLLKSALLLLDPKSILEQAGFDPLLWAGFCTESMHYGQRRTFTTLLATAGYSPERMQVAARALSEILSRPENTQTAFKTYTLGSALERLNFEPIEVPLKNYVKPNRLSSLATLTDYSLEGITIPSGFPYGKNHPHGHIAYSVHPGDSFVSIYLDAPAALVLHYKDQPVAVLSAFACTATSLFINQIQATQRFELVSDTPELTARPHPSHRWELEPLDWKSFLFDTICSIARTTGFTDIIIQSGDNNRWTKPDASGTLHLPVERARAIYDAFATSKGMVRMPDGNFYLTLD